MIVITPKRIIKVLARVVLYLTLASIAGEISKFFLRHDVLYGVIPLFSLRMELNIPTWYQSFTLLLCSIVAGAIAFVKKKMKGGYVLHWSALCIVFACLSLDEEIAIHESWNEPLRAAFHASGFFFFPWVVPGAVFVAIFALSFLPFLVALPAKTRWLFIVSGAVYVTGALGMELLMGRHYSLNGPDIGYAMIWTVGEILEMTGILIFLYALLSYMIAYMKEAQVRFEVEESTSGTGYLLDTEFFPKSPAGVSDLSFPSAQEQRDENGQPMPAVDKPAPTRSQ
jgi:hypothetical protein